MGQLSLQWRGLGILAVIVWVANFLFFIITDTRVRLSDLDTPEKVIEAIRDQGYFTICTRDDTPPFQDRDAEGNLVGFDIGLIKEIAHRWLEVPRDEIVLEEFEVKIEGDIEQILNNRANARKRLGNSKGVILVIIPAGWRVQCIEEGWADLLIATLSRTSKRCGDLECISPPYFKDHLKLLVRIDSEIDSICDLASNRPLGILEGTTADEHAKADRPIWIDYCDDYNDNVRPTLYFYNSQNRDRAIDDVTEEIIAAYMTDGTILEGFIAKKGYTNTLKVVGDNFAPETFHVAVPKEAQGLEELIQLTLQEMSADGTYDTLHKRLFNCDPPPFEIDQDTTVRPRFVKSDFPLKLKNDISCESVSLETTE